MRGLTCDYCRNVPAHDHVPIGGLYDWERDPFLQTVGPMNMRILFAIGRAAPVLLVPKR